ncbi:MAG: hypothetical protein ACUVUR_02285 [bacterium]
MWLIITAVAALIATICWWRFKGRYKLGFLSLMLWGSTVMILVDFILGYEGGRFIETTTDGLVKNGALLGLLMLVPVLVIWLGGLIVSRGRPKSVNRLS